MTDFPLDRFALPGLLTIAGMHQYGGFLKSVGAQRRKHSISPPTTDGPQEFVRTFRAQQNTLEFYPISLGSLWVGSVFAHPVPASLLYAGYLYGRAKYFKGYAEDAEKRLPGFYLSVRCIMGMLLLATAGVGHKLLRYYGNVDVFQLLAERFPACRRLTECA